MYNIVDSHCHLNFSVLKDNLNNILERARKENVKYFLNISIDLQNFEDILKLSNTYQNIWCTSGIHPNNVPEDLKSSDIKNIYKSLKRNIQNNKVVGIGETGLDYYRSDNNKKNQLISFEEHLRLSGEQNLPTIIHTRNADNDSAICIRNSVQSYNSQGLIHCFSSSRNLAKVALDNNFYISISGMITFKNANELIEIVKYIPLDKMLIETDAPYLAPEPHRGKKNEPSFIKYTLEKISQIKGLTSKDIARATAKNFFNLFTKINKKNEN